MSLSHQEAESIVSRLANIFGMDQPVVYYADDAEMKKRRYWAFCVPTENYIVFRDHEIPSETPMHEMGHLIYYHATGDTMGHEKSEGLAQWVGSLWLLNGDELLKFRCQVCGALDTKLSFNAQDASFICKYCNSSYDWKVG